MLHQQHRNQAKSWKGCDRDQSAPYYMKLQSALYKRNKWHRRGCACLLRLAALYMQSAYSLPRNVKMHNCVSTSELYQLYFFFETQYQTYCLHVGTYASKHSTSELTTAGRLETTTLGEYTCETHGMKSIICKYYKPYMQCRIFLWLKKQQAIQRLRISNRNACHYQHQILTYTQASVLLISKRHGCSPSVCSVGDLLMVKPDNKTMSQSNTQWNGQKDNQKQHNAIKLILSMGILSSGNPIMPGFVDLSEASKAGVFKSYL